MILDFWFLSSSFISFCKILHMESHARVGPKSCSKTKPIEQPIIVSSATHRSALNAAILEADGTDILKYHRWQIPLEPAFASRTHKMQGATAKFGVVSEPSAKWPLARGLDYVVASRPTESAKLILLAPLTINQFTAFPQERHNMRRIQQTDRTIICL